MGYKRGYNGGHWTVNGQGGKWEEVTPQLLNFFFPVFCGSPSATAAFHLKQQKKMGELMRQKAQKGAKRG